MRILTCKLAEAKKRIAKAENAYQILLQVHSDVGSDVLHDTEQRTQYARSVRELRLAVDRLKATLSSMAQF